jgi:hypothetical protein
MIPTSVPHILDSQEWRNTQSASALLVVTASKAGFGSKGFDPAL